MIFNAENSFELDLMEVIKNIENILFRQEMTRNHINLFGRVFAAAKREIVNVAIVFSNAHDLSVKKFASVTIQHFGEGSIFVLLVSKFLGQITLIQNLFCSINKIITIYS